MIDSELSLISGNTWEFYDEALQYITKYKENIGLERSLNYLLKVLHIALLSLKKKTLKVVNASVYEGYAKCDVKQGVTINSLQEADPKLSKFLGVYKQLIFSFQNGFYPDAQPLVDTINMVLYENDVQNEKQLNFSPEKVNIVRFRKNNFLQELEEIRPNYKQSDKTANDNFADYDTQVMDILKQRAKLDYIRQVVSKNCSIFKPGNEGNGEKKKKILKTLMIDYDLLLMIEDKYVDLAADLFTREYFENILGEFQVNKITEKLLSVIHFPLISSRMECQRQLQMLL